MGIDLISGVTSATRNTSAAAAHSVTGHMRAKQRAQVYQAICDTGDVGHTDDELQARLNLDGNSERPRRWELWMTGHIAVKRDEHGLPVTRATRTKRQAIVWVACER